MKKAALFVSAVILMIDFDRDFVYSYNPLE